MLAIGLALGSSALWGIADFLGGLQSRRRSVVVVLFGAQLAALVPVLVWVIASGDPAPGAGTLAWALGAGVGGCLGLAAFYRSLAIGTMSIVAPISATGAAVPVLAGLAEGERPAALQLAGAALAMGGVMLASREPDREPGAAAPAARRTAVWLALFAALGIGVALLGLGRASEGGGVPWALLGARLPGVVMLGAALAVLRPPPLRSPRVAVPIATLGLLDVAANALFALASTHGLLSLVSVVGSIYPAFTVLLARAVLRERVTRRQDAGVLATLAGVAAISAG